MKNWIYLFLLLFVTELSAQHNGYKFRFNDSSPVIENGDTLALAWSGGLNAPQFNTIDMNSDGIEDLVLFDQSFNRMVVFLSDGQSYRYSLELSETFPQGFNGIFGWVLMRDANCDGRKDIYTKANVGGQIYRNLSGPVSYPVWGSFDPLLQYDTTINIPISEADIPIFEDIDGDGDIDIATFEFSGGGTIDYFENLSVDLTGGCGISEYQRVTQCWGRIYECQTCGKYDINLAPNCLIGGSSSNYCTFRVAQRHAGSTSLAIDLDGDNDKDLLLGDIGCSEVSFLENVGSNSFTLFDSAELGFPFNTQTINFFNFPALFYEDVDFDGVKDLLVTPNSTDNLGGLVDMSKSTHFYKNTGTTSNPNFSYVQNDFLQDEMLDVGDYANPALVDYDADGDLDLFVGNKGRLIGGIQKGRLFYYENTGNANQPEFTLVDNDFLGLFSRNVENIRPFFQDLSGDGVEDFCFSWNENSGIDYELYYFKNLGGSGSPMSFDADSIFLYTNKLPEFSPGSPRFFNGDYVNFYDVSGDGVDDLILGISNFGYLIYYRNDGTINNPVWVEVNSNVGFLGINLGNTQLNYDFQDFDGNGDVDMILGDRLGRLKVYPDFINNVTGTDSLQPRRNLIANDTLSPGIPIDQKLNEFIKIAVGDLNDDSLPDLIVGTKSGGVHLFYNESTPVSGLSKSVSERKKLKVFPVPSSDFVYINIESRGELRIFDILGREINSHIFKESDDRFEIDLAGFERGIYLLKFKTDKGESYSGKFIRD